MRIKLDEAELAVMQWEYEETPLTVDEVGLRHGCSGQTVCKIAKRNGWKLRGRRNGAAVRRSPAAGAPAVASTAALRVRPVQAPGIAQRLCNVINRKLDQMEKDMQSGELSSADLERDAKTIASMIGGMQKVTPTPDEDKVSKPDAARVATVDNAEEVERLQREIVERFERIQSRREAEGGSQ